jgi:glycosyltransferase involved in cell wall biosynthesis
MRKVLFVHDGPIFKDHNSNFYGIHIKDSVIERYLNLGDHLAILTRVVIVDKEQSKKYSLLTNSQFDVIEIPNFKSIRLYIKNYPTAKRVIEDAVYRADVVICRNPSASSTIAANYALSIGKPIISELVACTFDAYLNYNWKGKMIAHYKMWVQQRLQKRLPYVIYVTKHFLQERYPSSAKQINCSNVELKPKDQNLLKDRIEKIKQSNKNKIPVIGTVAALDVPYKGQADVIKALAILKNSGIIYHYHLVGQGDDAKLRQFVVKLDIQEQVKFIGALPHQEVFDFYKQIDLYIQPSKQEGLPRALIEAMSTGCPALGARTAGIPELLDSNFIFKAGNVKEIVKLLTNLSQEVMLEQASVNFIIAQDYEKEKLDKRRKYFYDLFLTENNLK